MEADYQRLAAPPTKLTEFVLVVRTAAPMLLAIAGSAFTPLPCAFSLTGVPVGIVICLLIALANNYTSAILVRDAARLRVSGYEEVVFAGGGRVGLNFARAALVILLFGTLCGCLAAIEETGARASELAGLQWLGATYAGRASLIGTITVAVLLPLSLYSLGELEIVSLIGFAMMVIISCYVVALAVASGHGLSGASEQLLSAESVLEQLPEAASTFGYAFYIQPCALPLLRTLPPGDDGARVLIRALRLTFSLTLLAYLAVGIGGLVLFDGDPPQDLLQGFGGGVGAALAAFFCAYLTLCFPPILVPLRETIVRLCRELGDLGTPPPVRPLVADGSCGDLSTPLLDSALLPPHQNAALTAAIVGCALAVALLLPNSSATLFALTGSTGVCAVSYVLPVLSHWWLRPGGPLRRAKPGAAAGGSSRLFWAWAFLVLLIGAVASALSVTAIIRGLFNAQPVCAADDT